MKRNLVVFAFVLSLGVLVFPELAEARSIFRLNGPTVGAYFSTSQDCVEASVTIGYNTWDAQSPPGPVVRSYNDAWVAISVFDTCQSQQLVDAWGYGRLGLDLPGESESYIGRRLESARLKTTIPALDQVSGNTYDVSIDLTWTPIGPAERGNTQTHTKTPGYTLIEHSNGTFRPAECAGAVDYGTGNLTPDVSLGASIGILKLGQLVFE